MFYYVIAGLDNWSKTEVADWMEGIPNTNNTNNEFVSCESDVQMQNSANM